MVSNREIAEFLGWTDEAMDKYKLGPGKSLHCGLEKGKFTYGFDKSWDWLMPVVDKIESIKEPDQGYFGVYMSSNSCTIHGTRLHLDDSVYFDDQYAPTKLEATYNAVINFIRWYKARNLQECQNEKI